MTVQGAKPLGSTSSDLDRSLLLQYALFRWESAVVLAMTVILAVLIPDPFRGVWNFWQWWFWIILGGFAEMLIVLTTLSDPDIRVRVFGERLRSRFDLDAIVDLDLGQEIARDLELREQMELMLRRAKHVRDGPLRTQLQTIADDVERWIGALYSLARRLGDYGDYGESGFKLRRAETSTPAAIQALEERLARTADAKARAHLEQEIDGKRALLEELKRLDELTGKAAAQLAASHSALETIYTQMQLVAARGADGRRVQQLRGEIDDRVRSLSELEQEIAERVERVLERA